MTPRPVRCEVRETVTPLDVGGLPRERCGKSAAPRRILRYACNAVAAVRALGTRIWLRLLGIGLHKLLTGQRALLTCIP